MKQKLKDYGYMHMDAWDFLWSITAKAMLAAEILRPGGWRWRGTMCDVCGIRDGSSVLVLWGRCLVTPHLVAYSHRSLSPLPRATPSFLPWIWPLCL